MSPRYRKMWGVVPTVQKTMGSGLASAARTLKWNLLLAGPFRLSEALQESQTAPQVSGLLHFVFLQVKVSRGGGCTNLWRKGTLVPWGLKSELSWSDLRPPPNAKRQNTSCQLLSQVPTAALSGTHQLLSLLKSKQNSPLSKRFVLNIAIKWTRGDKISLLNEDLPEFSQSPLY